MKDTAPQISAGFGGMFQNPMGEGALRVREKKLLALAIGMAVRCEPCISARTENAVNAGATREQLIELAGVVVMMQEGSGLRPRPGASGRDGSPRGLKTKHGADARC
jgi:AhpD family alkylhydroperoxidase